MSDGYSGGLYRMQVFTRLPGGFAGGNQTAPTNGTTTHAIVYDSITQTDAANRELVNVPVNGGDGQIGNLQFGETGFNPFTLTTESLDNADIALLHGTVVDSSTNSEFEMSTKFSNATNVTDIGIILTYRFVDRESQTSKYEHLILPQCQAMIRTVYGGFQGKNTHVWAVSPQTTTKSIHGTSFSSYGMSVPNSKMDHYSWITDNPIHVTTYVADGTATTFNTLYKPLSTVVTVNATPNWFAVDGTDTALDSITTAGLATLAAAGSAGDVNVLVYETALVPV